MKTLSVPCLFYAGDADAAWAGAQRAAAAAPQRQFVSLPGMSHFTAWSESQQILPHALAFLQNNS
ncbi:MAG: hypothetical protein MUD01_05640 [Chloroflexaceae bacterium]|nr:hypothetical protein [Chloroflexaceae bacterium]